tara:strand:- start:346 stop:690 length:345 start_codon:yes stop_codon:yes gene_type:complete
MLNIKYRKSYFRSLDATDYAKLSYFDLLINDLTSWWQYWFLQDVMNMTTKDWLKLPCVIFVLLVPALVIFEHKEIRRMADKNKTKDGSWINYNGVYIYWRDVSDFNETPSSYRK